MIFLLVGLFFGFVAGMFGISLMILAKAREESFDASGPIATESEVYS